jgi:hypothetical protein
MIRTFRQVSLCLIVTIAVQAAVAGTPQMTREQAIEVARRALKARAHDPREKGCWSLAATLRNGVWHVAIVVQDGGTKGTVPYVDIRDKDGKVLRVHWWNDQSSNQSLEPTAGRCEVHI